MTAIRVAWIPLLAALGSCSSEEAGPRCPAHLGGVAVDGSASACPKITMFEILPSEVEVGSSVVLRGAGTDPGGAPLSYAWRAAGVGGGGAVVIADPSFASTTLRCDGAGPAIITFTVSSATCGDTVSGVVDCTGTGSDAGAP